MSSHKDVSKLARALRALPWFLALSALAPGVSAQPNAQTRFSLELSSGSGCPEGSDFVRQVIARVPTARQVDGEPGDVGFRVEIASGGVSTLTVTLPQGSSRRELRDVTCEEATTTFALIAALVLDARPEERLSAVAQATEPDEATPPAEAKPPEPPPEPAKPSQRKQPPPTLQTPKPTRGELHVGFDVGLGIESAVAPTPPPAGLVGLGILWDRFSGWSPELRAELLVTSSRTRNTAGAGTVALQLLAGRLSVCPLRFRLSPSWHVAACGTFDAGGLSGDGSQNEGGTSYTMTWLAGGAAARGELRLSEAFALELLAGGKRLVYDDIFTVKDPTNQDLRVYNVPKYSLGLELGLGVRL